MISGQRPRQDGRIDIPIGICISEKVRKMTVHYYRSRFPGIAGAGTVVVELHFCRKGKRITHIGIHPEETVSNLSVNAVMARGGVRETCFPLISGTAPHSASYAYCTMLDIKDADSKDCICILYTAAAAVGAGGWCRLGVVEED